MSKKKKINVAVIGAGNMGALHARVYSELRDVNLAAVSDIDEKTGRKIAKKFSCHYHKNYNEMLNRENIDAVSVAVPTSLHKRVALDVIRHKKHLLIEKPIAANVKEAKEIIRRAKRAKVKLAVGHIERFNPAVQTLKKIIEKGKIGKIITVMAIRVGLFPPRIKDVNVIIDLAIHDLDIFNYLLNQEPKNIFAMGGYALTNKREDYAEIFIRYPMANCILQVNWITPVKIRTLSVTGSRGYAALDYITQKVELYKSNYKRQIGDFGEFVIKFGESKKRIISIKKGEPLVNELKSFMECIRKNTEFLVTGEEGLKALIIAEKALRSLKNHRI